ncbi:MAG: hypothetical protein SGBAC_013162 [Bacillariaceae sp.]
MHQKKKQIRTVLGYNPSKSVDTLPTENCSCSFSDDNHSSVISAITLEDDFVSPRRPNPRFDMKLRSLSEQKRASDPEAGALEQCLDLLRVPIKSDRFSSCSDEGDARPCAMPTRKSSMHNLDYQAAQDNPSSFFLEEESPFDSIDRFDDDSFDSFIVSLKDGDEAETKEDDMSPSLSFQSFTVSLNDEDEIAVPVKADRKRRPRRSYRGKRNGNALETTCGGYSRTATEAQSLELIDVFGDRCDS